MLLGLSYRDLGIVSIVITTLAVIAALTLNRVELTEPISHHIALKRRGRIPYAIILTASQILMYAFFVKWLVPALHLPYIFILVSSLALLFQLTVAWVPLTTGKARRIHLFCANGTAALLPVMLILVLLSPNVSRLVIGVDISAIFILLICASLGTLSKKIRSYYLLIQGVCILAFYGVLITLTFTQ